MVEEPSFLYVLGTAGSGKSRFTAALKRWLYEHEVDAVTLNLDPGADKLPYTPDVDIRDWITLPDVMERYGLGPNGAQVVAADLVALELGDIQASLETFRSPFVLVDTPGQSELFVFRDAGRVVMEILGRERSMATFLIDPFLAKRPSAFVSQLLLSMTTQFRLGAPLINVLTKTDLLKEEERDRLARWATEPDALHADLLEERQDLYHQLNLDVFRLLEGMGSPAGFVQVSGETLEGMDDVYTAAQGLFAGGEDVTPVRDRE